MNKLDEITSRLKKKVISLNNELEPIDSDYYYEREREGFE